jgi:alpha-tubulin suppressor-like RCC1 family protein
MVPVIVEELYGCVITEIAAGNYHSMALESRGRASVYTWGGNGHGQLGVDTSAFPSPYLVPAPQKVYLLSRVDHIFAGGNYSMALGEDGEVFAWGSNKYGQLGSGNPLETSTPIRIAESHGLVVRSLSCGDSHMIILSG